MISKKYVFLLLFFCSYSWADFKVGGEFEDRFSIAGGEDYSTELFNKTSLKFILNYNDTSWRFFSDIRLDLLYGYNRLVTSQPHNYLYTIQKGKNELAIGLDVVRLFIKAQTSVGIFTIGRSYLNFGQPNLFNTLEWSKRFSLFDPFETKPGINMLSWDIGIGSYGKIKLFVGGTDSWDTPVAGGEVIFGASGFEFGTTYQYKGFDQNILGAFFKLDFYLGFFGTYAAHLNDITSGKQFHSSHEFSLGFDYSFVLGLTTLLLQQTFYYNSMGASSVEDLLTTDFGDYYFRGKSYSYSSLQLTVNQFVTLGTDVLVNMVDASGVVLPKGSFTLANNLTLDIVLGVFFGASATEFAPQPNLIPNVNTQVTLKASF
ncbi:MAG: hypothetical protein ACRCV0_01030 [Brevinema sp.]